MQIIKKTFLSFIKLYQIFISPNLGRNCRFYPSCSEYCYKSVEKYGLAAGAWKGLKRVARCGPWHPGGVDLP